MASPFDLFKLDPKTADLKAARRAYAILIKKHRPDKEPEKFREIREAYEAVLGYIQMREIVGTETIESLLASLEGKPIAATEVQTANQQWAQQQAPPGNPVEPPEQSGPNLDTELEQRPEKSPAAPETAEGDGQEDSEEEDDALPLPDSPLYESALALEAACGSKDPNAISDAIRTLNDQWRTHPDQTERWGSVVCAHIEDHPRPFADDLKPEDCILELKNRNCQVTSTMIDCWTRHDHWDKIYALADALIEREKELSSNESGFAMICCARACALTSPARAHRLSDLAFRSLPPHNREVLFHDLDVLLAVGKDMASLFRGRRETIARCVLAEQADPRDDKVRRAMRDLWQLGNERVSKQYVFKLFPDLRKNLDLRALPEPERKWSRAQKSSGSFLEGLSGHWWIISLLVLWGFRACSHLLETESSGSRSQPPPARQQSSKPRQPKVSKEVEQVYLELLDKERKQKEDWENTSKPLDLNELQPIYIQHPWLLEIRLELDHLPSIADAEARRLIEGQGSIKKDADRYPIMLEAFSNDDTLPPQVREHARTMLNSLKNRKLDSP